MMVLWLSLALADSGCLTPPTGDTVAVAWVSPVGRKVGAKTFVDVVPASAIRREDFQTVGELAHGLGLRKHKTPPKRPYKVTIFEVDPRALCRPVEGMEPGERVGGVAACESARTAAKTDGSGCIEDLPVYRIRWSEAAARGFCVLPAQRFVDEGRR
jgi:hypothetical protein